MQTQINSEFEKKLTDAKCKIGYAIQTLQYNNENLHIFHS